MDLAGLCEHLDKGRDCVIPEKYSMKADLSEEAITTLPYVITPLLGDFKGETGTHCHTIWLANETSLGICMQWWMEALKDLRQQEGCVSGPAFAFADGTPAEMHDYDIAFKEYLERLKSEHPELLPPDEDVSHYTLNITLHKTA